MAEFESLPYHDPHPTEADLSSAHALIRAAIPQSHTKSLHPSLSPSADNDEEDGYRYLKPLLRHALSTLSSQPQSIIPQGEGVDSTRYTSSTTTPPKDPLRQAQINSTYVRLRAQALSLLSANDNGKNAWLKANYTHLEPELKDLERELVGVRESVAHVNRERKAVQTTRAGEELGRLEEEWREGLERAVRVELALARLSSGLEQVS